MSQCIVVEVDECFNTSSDKILNKSCFLAQLLFRLAWRFPRCTSLKSEIHKVRRHLIDAQKLDAVCDTKSGAILAQHFIRIIGEPVPNLFLLFPTFSRFW